MNILLTGKMKKVDLGGLSIEEKAKEIYFSKQTKEKNKKLPHPYTSFTQVILEKLMDTEYVILDGVLYEFIDVKDFYANNYLKSTRNSDGTIDFIIGFNDSAGSLQEYSAEIIEVAEEV